MKFFRKQSSLAAASDQTHAIATRIAAEAFAEMAAHQRDVLNIKNPADRLIALYALDKDQDAISAKSLEKLGQEIPAFQKILSLHKSCGTYKTVGGYSAVFGFALAAAASIAAAPAAVIAGFCALFVAGSTTLTIADEVKITSAIKYRSIPTEAEKIMKDTPSFTERMDALRAERTNAIEKLVERELPALLAHPEAERLIDSFPAIQRQINKNALGGAATKKTIALKVERP